MTRNTRKSFTFMPLKLITIDQYNEMCRKKVLNSSIICLRSSKFRPFIYIHMLLCTMISRQVSSFTQLQFDNYPDAVPTGHKVNNPSWHYPNEPHSQRCHSINLWPRHNTIMGDPQTRHLCISFFCSTRPLIEIPGRKQFP